MATTHGEDPMTTDDHDLACIELVELVTDYFEGAVTATERGRIEHHLSGCDGCTTYVEQMRATIAAAGGVAPDDLPPAMVGRLLEVFRTSRSPRPER
jgi:anti-sigma factor RsiW